MKLYLQVVADQMAGISNVIEVMISQLLPNEAITFNDKETLMRR